MNALRSASAFVREVGPLVDLPGVVKCLAADNFIADDDGFLGCWGPNSFYVYRQQGRTELVWFSWDKDLAFWAPNDDIYNNVEKNGLRFARERGPYVLREAGKALGWPEADGR